MERNTQCSSVVSQLVSAVDANISTHTHTPRTCLGLRAVKMPFSNSVLVIVLVPGTAKYKYVRVRVRAHTTVLSICESSPVTYVPTCSCPFPTLWGLSLSPSPSVSWIRIQLLTLQVNLLR